MGDFDYVNGELVEIEPVYVTENAVLSGYDGPYQVIGAAVRLIGTHNGSVGLDDGASLTLSGSLNGSLHLSGGCTANIAGGHNGSLHIGAGATVHVTGAQNGSVHVEPGGLFRVEQRGRHSGSVHNDGRYELAGERGGTMNGGGEYVEESGSHVRQPTKYVGNSPVYEW